MPMFDEISSSLGRSFFSTPRAGYSRQGVPPAAVRLSSVSAKGLGKSFFFNGESDFSTQSPPPPNGRSESSVYQPLPPPPMTPGIGLRLDVMI